MGVVIGREFSHDKLCRVAGQVEAELSEDLADLVRSELVFQHGEPPDAVYHFKHALVQDAAYESLLRRRCQDVHATIAATLEARRQEPTVGELELLAHHYTQAGLPDKAVPYHSAAGRDARGRSAALEALSHLTTGLELLGSRPETPERDATEIEFQALLGSTYVQIRGNTSPEACQAYARAYELCLRAERPDRQFPVLWGVWLVKSIGGKSNEAARDGRGTAERRRRRR